MASQPIYVDPRTSIGGNKPPLEEALVMEFDANLREYDFDLLARITELEVKAKAAGPCEDTETVGRYGDHMKSIKACNDAIDDEREKLNRPLLNGQRALMSKAKVYKDRLDVAKEVIQGHLNDHANAEKKRLKAEADERQRLADEATAIAARAAEVERQRLQGIADAEAAIERARLQAIEDARAAAEAREVKVVEVVAQVVAAPAAPVFYAAPAPVYEQTRSDRGTLVTSSETWDLEIENIRLVPDLYLKNPAVIEALRKVIAPSVRGKTGLRAIKGCRIFSNTKASVR